MLVSAAYVHTRQIGIGNSKELHMHNRSRYYTCLACNIGHPVLHGLEISF